MTRAKPIAASRAIFAISASLGAVAVAYFALSTISRPSGFAGRVAQVARQLDEVDRLNAHLKTSSIYSTGAVCEADSSTAIAALNRAVGAMASSTNVAISRVTAVAQAPDGSIGGLQPITVTLEGGGQYQSVIRLLQALAKSSPSLFVDTLDLKSKGSSVSLSITGRLFCSTAHL